MLLVSLQRAEVWKVIDQHRHNALDRVEKLCSLPSDSCLNAARCLPRKVMRSIAACSVCNSWLLQLSSTSRLASMLNLGLSEADTCAQLTAEQSVDRVSWMTSDSAGLTHECRTPDDLIRDMYRRTAKATLRPHVPN